MGKKKSKEAETNRAFKVQSKSDNFKYFGP